MSEGDFEVMPRGTTEEIQAMRKFANDLILFSHQYANILPKEVLAKIYEMEVFYNNHNLKYRV
jgi:hypothetical protein